MYDFLIVQILLDFQYTLERRGKVQLVNGSGELTTLK